MHWSSLLCIAVFFRHSTQITCLDGPDDLAARSPIGCNTEAFLSGKLGYSRDNAKYKPGVLPGGFRNLQVRARYKRNQVTRCQIALRATLFVQNVSLNYFNL